MPLVYLAGFQFKTGVIGDVDASSVMVLILVGRQVGRQRLDRDIGGIIWRWTFLLLWQYDGSTCPVTFARPFSRP